MVGYLSQVESRSEKPGVAGSIPAPATNIPWIVLRRINKEGYLLALVPNHPNARKDGYLYDHRVVMENFLGRLLLNTEVVHHINGVRDDNRIENLELMTLASHSSLHHKTGESCVELICSYCEEVFLREVRHYNTALRKGRTKFYCGRSCMARDQIKVRGRIGGNPRPPVEWEHGTHNGYANKGCRCPSCTEAQADYMRGYKSRR